MSEPTRAEVHDVLVDARNMIDRDGWFGGTPGAFHSEGTAPRCALIAIDEVTDWMPPVVDAFAAANGIDLVRTHIPAWNNAPGRTKAEVLAAFDRAIAATAPEPDPSKLTAAPVPCESERVADQTSGAASSPRARAPHNSQTPERAGSVALNDFAPGAMPPAPAGGGTFNDDDGRSYPPAVETHGAHREPVEA